MDIEVDRSPWRVRPWLAGVGVFVTVLLLDLASKEWASAVLISPVCPASWSCFAVLYNTGFFLGLLKPAPDSLVMSLHWLAVPVVLAWLAWRTLMLKHATLNACFAMVAAGIVGNLMGRSEGAVVDWIAFGPVNDRNEWLFMNFADVAMVAGLGLLTAVLARRRWRTRLAYGR